MDKLTRDRATRRYLQIRTLQEHVERIERAIESVEKEIDDATDRRRDLRKEKADVLKAMREAAKDEGQLPLFNELVDGLIDCGIPRELLPTPDGVH